MGRFNEQAETLNRTKRGSRKFVTPVSLVAITIVAAYVCLGDLNRQGKDWVPGTVKVWPLADEVADAGPITFVDGFDQPLLSSNSLITSLDGRTFQRGVRRFDVGYSHGGNRAIDVFGSCDRLRVKFAFDHSVAALTPGEPMRPHVPGYSCTIDPMRWGVDEDYGVVWPQHGGAAYRFHIETGAIDAEPMALPIDSQQIYHLGDNAWAAIVAGEDQSRLVHSSGAECTVTGKGTVLHMFDANHVVLGADDKGLTFRSFSIEDGEWTERCEPFRGFPEATWVLAVDKTKRRFLFGQQKVGPGTTGLLRQAINGAASLLLLDAQTLSVMARHDVEIESTNGDLPMAPWRAATFSPAGERLFLVTELQRCLEVDVAEWIGHP